MTNAERNTDWRDLYEEAVLEFDPEKMLVRIDSAQEAIRDRVRELWYEGSSDIAEQSHLDAAFYFLGMLRTIAGEQQYTDVPDELGIGSGRGS